MASVSRTLVPFLVICAVFELRIGAHEFAESDAVGPCILGHCQPNHVCQNNQCFPKLHEQAQHIGDCVNGLCPYGYKCSDTGCVKSKAELKKAIGPCINNMCPNGYTCSNSDSQCYP
uniref:CC domain-containing protein n=1 Tax=Steinernema glaseri TaxID=37863 RepID=A0A1I7YFC7_9BILA